MATQYKYIFFDLDRTLWDYDANSSRALSMLFEKYGLADHFDSPAEFIRIYNYHNDILWEEYRQGRIKKNDLRSKRFNLALMEKKVDDPELSIRIGNQYMEITPKLNILAPNTIQTLEYLEQKHYRLFILTNGFLSTQQKKMSNSGLDRYFERIYSSEEIGVNKPHREIFHWAVSGLHAHKKECLMIGDDVVVDVKGAADYGLNTVWFNPGRLESKIAPTHTIGDMSELTTIL